jgi:hypothetical protein
MRSSCRRDEDLVAADALVLQRRAPRKATAATGRGEQQHRMAAHPPPGAASGARIQPRVCVVEADRGAAPERLRRTGARRAQQPHERAAGDDGDREAHAKPARDREGRAGAGRGVRRDGEGDEHDR